MQNIQDIRKEFPILERKIREKPLIYLDNAATTQLPVCVLETMEEQYRLWQANIHRGVHYLSEHSTIRVENVRRKAAEFIGGVRSDEIVFTSGTTGSVNLIARAFSDGELHPGDIVVTTQMEHHSNLVPWQEACRRSRAVLRVVPVTDRGELDRDAFCRCLKEKPKLLAVTAVSNVLGTVNPIREMAAMAHDAGAAVLVDGAQFIRHEKVDVKALDCDFFCFSGHKMMAPTGVGILYGKHAWLKRLPPVEFGGGMVDEVTEQQTGFDDPPFKFEAGTQNIAGIIGLGAAIDYLERLGPDLISSREKELLLYAEELLRRKPGVRVLGSPAVRAGAISFHIADLPCYDAARLLDQLGIAVRSGHHCAQPLLRRFGLESAIRISPAFYNTKEELDAFSAALDRILTLPGIKHE